mmetsp:Transcript_12944/g.25023  ORF Transcript_12944/g.25023 Transcript_12944/m.25023 type:complete len:206 (-) Transcript_12944:464-1081(-)
MAKTTSSQQSCPSFVVLCLELYIHPPCFFRPIQKQLQNGLIVLFGCSNSGSGANVFLLVDVCTCPEQQICYISVVAKNGPGQSGRTCQVPCVNLRFGEQCFHTLCVHDCQHQGGHTTRIRSFCVRPCCQQRLNSPCMPIGGCPHQGGIASSVLAFKVLSAFSNNFPYSVDISNHRRLDQSWACQDLLMVCDEPDNFGKPPFCCKI